MLRSTASKMMWVGRATVFLVGLAVILALVVGFATAALAGTGVGGTFNLGKLNTVNRISQLVGATDNAMLRVDNNSAGINATALDLRVEPGHTPMKVDSSTQVSNLNADLVDGRSASSFVANSTYTIGPGRERLGTLEQGGKVLTQSCLAGDRMLSGGPASVNSASSVLDSFALNTNTWQVRINDSAVAAPGDNFTVVVLCADQ